MKMHTMAAALAALGLAAACMADGDQPAFFRFYTDDFAGDPATRWAYIGETIAGGQPLFRYDAGTGTIAARWDQATTFTGYPNDPYIILPSAYWHPLGIALTDRDTFRVRARLVITPGSVPDTTEFYQIANLGFYNPATTGPDRLMTDNYAVSQGWMTTAVTDAMDFVEFNYFINNDSYGFNPNITALIGAHVDGPDGDYTTGSGLSGDPFFHDTDMGANHWLPTGTNLFVELTYCGGAADTTARRARCAVYTDSDCTDLLHVAGVSMYYWTQPLPTNDRFTVTHVGFRNYAGENWGGANGAGAGAWDDVAVDISPFPYAPNPLLEDPFDGGTAGQWVYGGVTNASGQPLFRYDVGDERVLAEWDQTNLFSNATDPYGIVPSSFTRRLPRQITDRDSFVVEATLSLAPGSVPDTTEFYQIANVGLYNTAAGGADRLLTDNYAVSQGWMTTAVTDAMDFVEFNYFINNDSYGFNPNITAVIGAHVDGPDGDYTTGSGLSGDPFFHDTDMGVDRWLPIGTNLYLVLAYLGASPNTNNARRAYTAIYTDPERTRLLSVNGVPMSYWTQPLPAGKRFTAIDVGFFNYVGEDWGGGAGAGQGTWDDVSVSILAPIIAGVRPQGDGLVMTWPSVPGRTYRIESTTNLAGGGWTSNGTVTATGRTAAYTNYPGGSRRFYRVAF